MEMPHKPRLAASAASFVLLAALVAGGCSSDNTQQFVDSGKAFLARRDYAAAVIQLKNAVQKAQDNGEVRFLLGSALRGASELGQAEIELRKALSIGYDPDLVVPELVRTMIDMGEHEKAIRDIEAATLTKPAIKAELLALKGDALAEGRQWKEARFAYDQALGLVPGNVTAQLGHARLAIVDNELGAAEVIIARVLAAQPDSVAAWVMRAALQLRERKTQDAIASYDRAIAAHPEDPRPYLGVIPLLIAMKDQPAAERQLAALRKVSPHGAGTAYLDALVNYAAGRLEPARNAIQATLKALPEDPRAQVLGGSIEHDVGNYGLAESLFAQAIKIVPNEVQPRRLLASTYLRSGQVVKARDILAPLLAATPPDPRVLALAGEVELQLRQPARAIELLTKAQAALPDDNAVRVLLGRARIAAGQTALGVADLEAASAAGTGDVSADMALVEHLLRERKTDLAFARAQQLTAKHPDDARAHYALAAVHLAQQDNAKARAELERCVALAPVFLPAVQNLAALDVADGKAEDARNRFRTVIAKDPRNQQAAMLLAATLQKTGAPVSDVVAVLDKSIAENLTSVPLRLAKIKIMLATGDAKGALEAALAAQANVPDDASVLYALAQAQQATGDLSQAEATYGKLAGTTRGTIAPFLGQAEVFAASKNWPLARAALMKALELKPDHLPARLALVDVAVKSGALQEARAAALDIQKRFPGLGAGFRAEAQVLDAMKQPVAAEKLLRDTLARIPDRDLVLALNALLVAGNRGADADRVVDEWLAKHPDDFQTILAAGERRMGRGEYREAAAWYQRALKSKPQDIIALNNLAWVLGKLGDPKSLEYGKRALAQAPRNAALLDTVGALNVQFGHVAEGVKDLEAAVAQAPGAVGVRINLARGLIKVGRKDEAEVHLGEAMKLATTEAVRKEIDQLRGGL
jgi:putative PEP-CTERM system TPR-repeat lipoprotein